MTGIECIILVLIFLAWVAAKTSEAGEKAEADMKIILNDKDKGE